MECNSICIAVTKDTASFFASLVEKNEIIATANVIIKVKRRTLRKYLLQVDTSIVSAKYDCLEKTLERHCIERYKRLFLKENKIIQYEP